MELKVSKEITGKWQNQRLLKLQAAGINFEKLLGWTVFKNPNFNPFQSSSIFSHPWHLLFLLSYFNLPFKVLSGYFYVFLNLKGIS